MHELLLILFPILLVDVLNPVLFAVMVFAAGSSKPVVNSSMVFAGHTLAYFIAGIVIALGLEQITERLANPSAIDFGISGVIGALLVWAFFRMRGEQADAPDEPDTAMMPLSCFALGATINFVGLPFALPYFGAIDQVLKADLSTFESLTTLALYNACYALVFSIVPIAVLVAGNNARPFLERINDFLLRASSAVLPWLLLALGAWLLVDAGYYAATGDILGW